jgi:hypothetical protein
MEPRPWARLLPAETPPAECPFGVFTVKALRAQII